MKKREVFWLSFIAVFFCFAMTAMAEETPVQGCYATYNSMTGKFAFEPFLKIADKEYDGEEGSEIIGFRPWCGACKDENGEPFQVNVLDSRFIPLNTAKKVPAGTTMRYIRCPQGLW